MEIYKLIGPFTHLLTMQDLPIKGALQDQQLPIIYDAGMLLLNGEIHDVGDYETLKNSLNGKQVEIFKINQPAVCLPGFVDCHTHIAFGGNRANDFALRNAGSSYLEIANAGGGIWSTVKHTRELSQDNLKEVIIHRANQLLAQGITTVEVKSGYGLSVDEELKMLRAIRQANKETPATLIATCLAAHMLPKDFVGSQSDYLAEIASKLFPILINEKLTNRIDAFIEESAFSASAIEPYFAKAKSLGFDLTVHADQFTPAGSAVAIAFEASSADHLEVSSDVEIQALAASDVLAVALPGASMGIGCSFAPARKLLDAGASLAIASDWNPGSAPMGNLLTQATVLATFEKLSNAEVLAAITYRAAAALDLKDRGKLQRGYLADFIIFPTGNYQDITYLQGTMKPSQVWKEGQLQTTN